MLLALALVSFSALLSLALIPVARKSGAPLLLIVLGIGMLIGEDGPGGYQFSDYRLAFDVGSVALAIILFAGGVETERSSFKKAATPSLMLAFYGVIVTAGVVGVAMHYLLDLPWMVAFLLGAVLAPTDAAATFMMIRHGGLELRERLKNTLMLESGFNDPASIGLTIVLTAIIGSSDLLTGGNWLDYSGLILLQFAIGSLGGILGGQALSYLLNKLPLPEGTYPVFAIAGALFIFSAISLAQGSGFLAVYIAGIFVRNRVFSSLERIANFSEGMQWMSQLLLFLLLGLLVTPSELPHAVVSGLICMAVLTFIARPIAVFATVSPFGFSIKELVFLSWVGFRGAVPILLAIYPIIEPGPINTVFFNTVFVVVVTSLILQGFTANPLGKLLKLDR